MSTNTVQGEAANATLPPMLDTKQAGYALGVSTRTITRMCEQEKIKAVKVNTLWRINRDALLEQFGLAEVG